MFSCVLEALDWELELVEVAAVAEHSELQKLCHDVYNQRCVAQEQGCLLLHDDRQQVRRVAWTFHALVQALRWLNAMSSWFLGHSGHLIEGLER